MGKRVPLADKSIGQLKKILDAEVSIWVRNYWSEDGESVQCFTCNTVKPIKQMHCGHYIPRNISPTRYQVGNAETGECWNLAAQCVVCNTFKQGMSFAYRQRLVEMAGEESVLEMEEKARQPFKFDKIDLIAKIGMFRQKNREAA